jgi:hypothetical protein
MEGYTDGELTSYSNTTAVNSLITTATADMATSSDLTTLQSNLETYVDGALGASNAGVTQTYLTSVLAGYASATDLTDLEASIGTFDANGNITALSTALSNQVTSVVAQEGYASATDVSNLVSEIGTFDTNGNLTGLSTALSSQIISTIAQEDYAEATDLSNLQAQIGTFDANGDLTGLSTALSNQVQNVVASENLATAQSVTNLTATVTSNNNTLTSSVSTNQTAIANVNGNLTAAYGITVDSGGSIAGMQLLSNSNNSSSITFNSDVFTIDVNGSAVSPFVVTSDGIALNGAVTFSNASTGSGIDYTDLATYLSNNSYATTSDIPSAFTDADVQSYLDAQGYVAGQNALDDAQIATYLTDNNYVTTTTTIVGGQISTGIIASGDYADSTPNDGFSDTGMAINLDTGSLHSENFYINPDGSANFGGSHSSGSIGLWTVDETSGSLMSDATQPEIVLDPSGTYSEVGDEKVVISSKDLSTISPTAGVSMDFRISALTEDLPSYNSGSGNEIAGGTSMPSPDTTTSPGNYRYYFPDITGSVDGFYAADNISFQNFSGGNYSFVLGIPSQEEAPFSLEYLVQWHWGVDHGWGFTTPGDTGGGTLTPDVDGLGGGGGGTPIGNEPPTTILPNVADVIGFDYEYKLKLTLTPTGVSGMAPVSTHTITLKQGSVKGNLSDFSNVNSTTQPRVPNNDHEYIAQEIYSTGWESTTLEGSGAAPSDATGFDVSAEFEYDITNIFVEANSNIPSQYGDVFPFAILKANTNQIPLSSQSNTFSPNALSNVIFTGATSKVNVGLNGVQVRGDDGFVAIGDVTNASSSVLQVWGDAEVFGTLTSNVSETFSDKRLKDNITPICDALGVVSKLAPVSYSWKPEMMVDQEKRYGFIAQDVKEVLPTIVKENKHFTLESNNIISINTAAIKELMNKIYKLEEEIKILKENNG